MNPSPQDDHLVKWRMILGQTADPEHKVRLGADLQGIDQTLEALYDADRQGGLGGSSPNVNRWLGDIRKYFPTDVVQLMQQDALERLKLDQMLLEPELLSSVTPNVSLVGTLLSLKKVIPSKTKETAREVVRQVVKDLEQRLRQPMIEDITGALRRSVRNRRPRLNEIDWHSTIRRNLKHYQPEYKTIVPHELIGFGKKGQSLRQVILLVDQSGSMAASVVFASVLGAVMASIRSLKTHMVVFDTEVVDMTQELDDPVDLLFGTQLGGGTDIHKAMSYAAQLISDPSQAIVILISDLYEGGNRTQLIKRVHRLRQDGVQVIALLALSDEGKPSYDKDLASQLHQLDVPTFACNPDQFPSLMAAAINKQPISEWRHRNNIAST